MNRICIICGVSGKFSFFGKPDHTGVIAMFSHITGYKETLFGSSPTYEHHLVTRKQLLKTDWFETFLSERDIILERKMEEMKKKAEEDYNREWIKEMEDI